MDDYLRECDVSVIVLAGGTGRRFGSSPVPKLLMNLNGKPLIAHTLETALSLEFVQEIAIVCHPSISQHVDKIVAEAKRATTHPVDKVALCEGGDSRTASVGCGLKYTTGRRVMIHDGDRPLASKALYHRVLSALKPGTGVVPVMSPTDTVIQENHEGRSVSYLPRNQVLLAQTPQAFITKEYRAAHEKMQSLNGHYADDGSVFAGNGGNLHTVPGERSNVKVTFPVDVSIVEFYLDAMKDE